MSKAGRSNSNCCTEFIHTYLNSSSPGVFFLVVPVAALVAALDLCGRTDGVSVLNIMGAGSRGGDEADVGGRCGLHLNA